MGKSLAVKCDWLPALIVYGTRRRRFPVHGDTASQGCTPRVTQRVTGLYASRRVECSLFSLKRPMVVSSRSPLNPLWDWLRDGQISGGQSLVTLTSSPMALSSRTCSTFASTCCLTSSCESHSAEISRTLPRRRKCLTIGSRSLAAGFHSFDAEAVAAAVAKRDSNFSLGRSKYSTTKIGHSFDSMAQTCLSEREYPSRMKRVSSF